MHVQTHVLAGWCLGNLFPFTRRERFFCMLAASLPDLDGLGILFGQESYWDFHHILGHNLAAGLVLSLALCAFSTRRIAAFAVYLGLFHLHLLMDSFGSGQGWGIPYLWPFWRQSFENPFGWAFYSWQNIVAAFGLVGWSVAIMLTKSRSPLELPMPSLDRQLVAWFQKLFHRRLKA